jgi:hypothetical protein
MNIFILHRNPVVAARYHCDKHVVKMISETSQMISNTIRHIVPSCPAPLMERSHPNHPCAVWMRERYGNTAWSVRLLAALLREYDHRYGHPEKFARSRAILKWCQDHEILLMARLPTGDMTPFVQAMPNQYRNPDPVEAYRAYYIGEKAGFARWTNRKPPAWWPNK